MRPISRHNLFILVLAMGAGCQPSHSSSDQEQRAAMREAWKRPAEPAVEHPQSMVVAQGQSPLVYQAQQAGTFHVMDLTTNEPVATASVGGGTILSINEAKGVFADERRLRPGPMPGGHSYSIVLDLDPSDVWRVGVEAPKPRPPASQPVRVQPQQGETR